ncbi:MAG: hypothetical protein AB8F95_11190 [Bacteroidia bacterium]
MRRIIISIIAIGFLASCQGDTHAQSGDAGANVTYNNASTSIDSPVNPQDSPAVANRGLEPPQDTLKPKSIQIMQAEAFLMERLDDESTANEVRVYIEKDQKVSAVRTLSKATDMALPEAKAFVDSLEVLMGTAEVEPSPKKK